LKELERAEIRAGTAEFRPPNSKILHCTPPQTDHSPHWAVVNGEKRAFGERKWERGAGEARGNGENSLIVVMIQRNAISSVYEFGSRSIRVFKGLCREGGRVYRGIKSER
jgi:hypothetical protein